MERLCLKFLMNGVLIASELRIEGILKCGICEWQLRKNEAADPEHDVLMGSFT